MKYIDGEWIIREPAVEDRKSCYVAAAIIGAAVIGAGAAAYSSNQASGAAEDASTNAQQSADKSLTASERQYNQAREDFRPYREAGNNALTRLNAASNGDYSSFQKSPNYEFTRQEGTRDLGNSFAARGGAFSGNALKALSEYNQNLASGQYNNWWQQQQGLVNTGGTGTSGTASAGAQNSANAVNIYSNNALAQNNALFAGANARASGVNGAADSINQGVGNYLMYQNMQKKYGN